MILHLSTWPEIEAFLNEERSIVIPIGSNEQHGPTGLLGTDWLCPELIAHRAEAIDPKILIGPTFNIGMAQHHLAFPGTISLRPSTMISVLQDWVASLTRGGFRTLYFLNGHGGNISTIEAAFSEIYAGASFAGRELGYALHLRNWWDLPGVGALAKRQFPVGHGSHATPSEIAITFAAYPEAIRSLSLDPRVANAGPIRDSIDFRARHPDGRMGSDPTQASVVTGRELIETAAKALLADHREFVDNER